MSELCPICKKSQDRCKCVKEALDTVVIGSPEAAAWKTIRMDCEFSITKNKRDIELLEISRVHAKKREEEEIEKFNKA